MPIFTITGITDRTVADPSIGKVSVGFSDTVEMTENTTLLTETLKVDSLSITGIFKNIWTGTGQSPTAGQILTGNAGSILTWSDPPIEEETYNTGFNFDEDITSPHGSYNFYFSRVLVEGTAGVQQIVTMVINMYGTTSASTDPIAVDYFPFTDGDFSFFTAQIPDGYTPLSSLFPANNTYVILGTIPVVDRDYSTADGGFPAIVTLYRTDSGGPRYFIRIFLLPQISNTGGTDEYVFGSTQKYPFATDSLAVIADDSISVSRSLTFTYLGENL